MRAIGMTRTKQTENLRADLARPRMKAGQHLERKVLVDRSCGAELVVEVVSGLDSQLSEDLKEIKRYAPPFGESLLESAPFYAFRLEHS